MSNEVARSNRIHIGLFGACNAGKSSLLNALAGQQEAIVSEVAGTTTDVVKKNMEITGLGPCVLMDTAGYDDFSELGELRLEKTRKIVSQTDLALLVLSGIPAGQVSETLQWKKLFEEQKVPVIFVLNKVDREADPAELLRAWKEILGKECIPVSAHTGDGMEQLLSSIHRFMKERDEYDDLTGSLVAPGDVVMLVMPQDIQAPKGRLILPQVQTLRNLLDKQCIPICCTMDQMPAALEKLAAPPALIITDSQVFKAVQQLCPAETRLTSFSILFARHKGDISLFVKGAEALQQLTPHSRVLIAESCTHTPQNEDIGRVKLPRLLRKKVGEGLQIDIVSGNDFPQDLTVYDLIIHCGACMFTRRHVLSRVARAEEQHVPITNYGIALAALNGILSQVVYPEP